MFVLHLLNVKQVVHKAVMVHRKKERKFFTFATENLFGRKYEKI